MNYFLINGADFSRLVKSLKVSYETLVSDSSGRNANGDTVIDIVGRKIKLAVGFIPMSGADMEALLAAVSGYVLTVAYRDPQTGANKSITAYTGTPEPDYYTLSGGRVLYKELSLSFIEL